MSDVYEIWLYPLHDWWKTVTEMLDFMYTGQMGNFIFRPVINFSELYILVMETTESLARERVVWPLGALHWLFSEVR